MKWAVASTIAQVLANNSLDRLLLASAEDVPVERDVEATCAIKNLIDCKTAAGGKKVKEFETTDKPNGCYRNNRTQQVKFNTNGDDTKEFYNHHAVGCVFEEAKCVPGQTRIPGAESRLGGYLYAFCQADGTRTTDKFACHSGVVQRRVLRGSKWKHEIMSQKQVNALCPTVQGQCAFSCGDDYIPFHDAKMTCDQGTLAYEKTSRGYWRGIEYHVLDQLCEPQECMGGESYVTDTVFPHGISTTAKALQCQSDIEIDAVKYKCHEGMVTNEDGLLVPMEYMQRQCRKVECPEGLYNDDEPRKTECPDGKSAVEAYAYEKCVNFEIKSGPDADTLKFINYYQYYARCV